MSSSVADAHERFLAAVDADLGGIRLDERLAVDENLYAHHFNGAIFLEEEIDGVLPPPSATLTPFSLGGNLIPLLIGLALIIGAIALPKTERYRRT